MREKVRMGDVEYKGGLDMTDGETELVVNQDLVVARDRLSTARAKVHHMSSKANAARAVYRRAREARDLAKADERHLRRMLRLANEEFKTKLVKCTEAKVAMQSAIDEAKTAERLHQLAEIQYNDLNKEGNDEPE